MWAVPTLLLAAFRSRMPAPAGAAAAPAEPARQENDEMDGIDPEFIAALPPELQAEVLEQQRRERRLRQAAARRAEAQQQVSCHAGRTHE